MSDMTVANTILTQLGGNRLIAMTGAKKFVGSEEALTFQFPNSKGPNSCRITLTAMDLYDIQFIRIRKRNGIPELKVVAEYNGVYADQLQSIFTDATGLYTHL